MTVLGLLLAALLPLHGIVNAAGSILSPAHYHEQALSVEPHQLHGEHDAALIHADAALSQHHDHDHDDHHDDAHQNNGGTAVGHHAHALDATDVVYLDGESEASERGASGKQPTSSGDALLPGWWMALMSDMGAQVLPEPGCEFRSQAAAPLLRPPSASARYS